MGEGGLRKFSQRFNSMAFPIGFVAASSLICTTLMGVHRGVLGVLGVLQSTLRPENCTPNFELLLARTAWCWPPGNAGYKWSPHPQRRRGS